MVTGFLEDNCMEFTTTGGHRPLLMMSFLRRLALKSVMAAKKEAVENVLARFSMVLEDQMVQIR